MNFDATFGVEYAQECFLLIVGSSGVFSPSTYMIATNPWVGICDVCVSSSIIDEGVIVRASLLYVQGWFIFIKIH